MSNPNIRDTWIKEHRCPYCGDQTSEENPFCCNEVHGRYVWIDEDGNETEEID